MYYSLQIGRSVAALIVVLFHLGGAIAAEKYFAIQEFTIPFSFGHSGVQFFFVLSGFIIFNIHKNDFSQPNKLGKYLKKRIIRIYPVFIVIFGVIYTLVFFTSLRSTLPLDPIVIIKTLLLLPQKDAPVLGVAWTLQYEVVFYFTFALLIINKKIMYLFGIIWIYFNFLYVGTEEQVYIKMIQSNNILLFIFGIIVAYVNSLHLKKINFFILFWIGISFFSLVALNEIFKYVNIQDTILLYGISSSIIILSIINIEKDGFNFKKFKKFNLLGDASYSLYLIHYPLISILAKISIILGMAKYGVIGALSTYFMIFIICLFSAILFNLYIEKPMLKYLQNKFIQN